MKTLVMIVILACCCLAAGCLEEVGAGAAGGYTFSETVKGLQADLERREAALVERYNNLIAAGAKAEDLEQVKQQIATTQLARQGTQTVSETNWKDPTAVGGGIGTLAALAYAFYSRKKLVNTTAGIKAYRSTADEKTKNSLDSALLAKGVT